MGAFKIKISCDPSEEDDGEYHHQDDARHLRPSTGAYGWFTVVVVEVDAFLAIRHLVAFANLLFFFKYDLALRELKQAMGIFLEHPDLVKHEGFRNIQQLLPGFREGFHVGSGERAHFTGLLNDVSDESLIRPGMWIRFESNAARRDADLALFREETSRRHIESYRTQALKPESMLVKQILQQQLWDFQVIGF